MKKATGYLLVGLSLLWLSSSILFLVFLTEVDYWADFADYFFRGPTLIAFGLIAIVFFTGTSMISKENEAEAWKEYEAAPNEQAPPDEDPQPPQPPTA